MVAARGIGKRAWGSLKRCRIVDAAGTVGIAEIAAIVEMVDTEGTDGKLLTSAAIGAGNALDFTAGDLRLGMHAWDSRKQLRIVRVASNLGHPSGKCFDQPHA
jgi:hypothetical protein